MRRIFTFLSMFMACMMVAETAIGQGNDILDELNNDKTESTTAQDNGDEGASDGESENGGEGSDAGGVAVPDIPDGTSEGADGATEAAEGAEGENADAANDDQADAEPSTEEPGWFSELISTGALGLLIDGGLFMWPILIMGVLATGVIIERYRSLKMLDSDSLQIREDVQSMLQDDEIEKALRFCEEEQGPVPAVLASGLRKYYVLDKLDYDAARIEEQVVKAMDDYSVHIVGGLEKHLPVLATISSAAPMLGFLGTVQGMIVAFANIVEQMGETNIVEAAAGGIQVSLLTTCFGLIVGIPAFMAFNYFTSVINRFVLEVEQSATELIEGVTLQLAVTGKDS